MRRPITLGRVRFQQYVFDPSTLELWQAGAPVHLPPKPSRALGLLVERAGSLVTREELHGRVWPDTIVELDQGLNTCIRHLRATLGDPAETPIFIETVPRRGYRFIAPVVQVDRSPVPDTRPPQRTRAWAIRLVAGFAAILVAGGAWAMREAIVPRQPVRLAVLPFQSLGSDDTDRLFSDGLSEELITTLAGLNPERLVVVARASSAKFAGGNHSALEIGDALDVDFFVEGSVRPDGEGYRISARLIRVADAAAVWSDQYDRTSDETVSTQEWLASRLSSAVLPAVTVSDGGMTGRREPLPQARVSWLMARHLLNREDSSEAERSLTLLREVVDTDPSFAMAHVSLARALLRLNRVEEVESALTRAFELDPDLPEGYLIRGQLRLRQWRLDEAGEDLEKAASRSSSDSRIHDYYAYYLSVVGRHDEARREIFRAAEIDPISSAIFSDAGIFAYWAGRNRDAIADCERSLTVALPERRIGARRCLLAAYEAAGMLDRARDQATAILEFANAATEIPQAMSAASDAQTALQHYRRWAALPHNLVFSHGSATAYNRARAAAVLGDVETAMSALEEAFEAREPGLIQMGVDPRLDLIRDDDRFRAMARAVGVG